VVGVVFSVALFVASEIIGPRAEEAKDDVLNRYQTKLDQQTELQWRRDVNFNNDVAGHEWKIGAYRGVESSLGRTGERGEEFGPSLVPH
jgi:lipopolysaccharide export LptBFGC system permease protein LptF